MKGEKRPHMLLYLLVGALLLSTALNCYFLLQLDGRTADEELEAQLLRQTQARQELSVQLPATTEAAADTLQEQQP
ncbi:hypothetical protein [Hymenobacter metallicola]|uniref:Uncharacterized protein n=1 Tax=Hymenobacter metallicola TaxID=2563114 RepID=A0A4Z0QIT2_9BACT|nr:hypothetical protein [Hymenobacter metallicola]TGE29406.1 hypothetical protein E5K02_08125 [Hymenobacter metallicola]